MNIIYDASLVHHVKKLDYVDIPVLFVLFHTAMYYGWKSTWLYT
jgi:hypothetical protein